MKFACEVCQTKYSISDEKVRRKVLKIRCKQCSAIITVRESGAEADAGAGVQADSGVAPALAREQPWQEGEGASDKKKSEQSAAKRSTGEAPIVRLVPRGPARPPTPAPSPDWYLAVNGQQFGPMALAELQARLKRGEALDDDHVWTEGLAGWQMIREVEELRAYCQRKPPPLPRDASAMRPLPSPPGRLEESVPPPSPVARTSDSGLSNVFRPPSGEYQVSGAMIRPTAGMMAAPGYLPALVAPQTQSPPWITIGFGVGFTLMAGILGLVVYALFFRGMGPESAAAPAVSPAAPSSAAPVVSPTIPNVDPRMLMPEDSRQPGASPTPRASRVARAAPKTITNTVPVMTEEQRRLAELYGTKPDTKPTVRTASQQRQVQRITDRDIAQLQRENQAGLKFCYERAAKRDPSLKQVKISVTVEANSSGNVTSVSLSDQRGTDFGDCLQKTIRRWPFPNAGSEYSITFPLLFQGM